MGLDFKTHLLVSLGTCVLFLNGGFIPLRYQVQMP
jgi:hypothetical protein